jgi:hypothetical protein
MAKAKKQAKAAKGAETQKLSPDAPAPVRVIVSNLPRDAAGNITKKPIEVDKKAAENPRQAILTAFGNLGGVRWLVKLARKYPKDFAGLLAKAMPQDVNISGTVGYVPLRIPVEQRDAIPGEFVDITPKLVTHVTEELDPFT